MSQNYNTWGGKNNSWGNRNKKNNQSSSSNNQSPNKLFSVFVGGMITIAVANSVFGAIGDVISNIKATFTSKKEEVIETEEYSGVDIDDVKDIIEDLYEESDVSIRIDEDNIVEVSYDVFNNSDTYNNSIINTLSNYNNNVVFIATSPVISNENELKNEYERIQKIIMGNSNSISNFSNVRLNGTMNYPDEGNLFVVVTFD